MSLPQKYKRINSLRHGGDYNDVNIESVDTLKHRGRTSPLPDTETCRSAKNLLVKSTSKTCRHTTHFQKQTSLLLLPISKISFETFNKHDDY